MEYGVIVRFIVVLKMVCFCVFFLFFGSGDLFFRIFVCDFWFIIGEEEFLFGIVLFYLFFFRGFFFIFCCYVFIFVL